MRRLSFAAPLVLSILIWCPSASASGGPVILGGAYGAGGVTDSAGAFNYVVLGAKKSVVARISTTDGEVVNQRQLDGSWALPAVTFLGDAGGLSFDGRKLVLIDTYAGNHADETHFRILDAATLRTTDRVNLDGAWSFDALSPEGGLMYLVQYHDPRDPFDYRIRQYDIPGAVLRGGSLVDPDEPDEKMTGQPVSRVTSPDGSVVYTLYGGGEETFIHALKTEIGQAECIDLEAIDPRRFNPFELDLSADPDTGVLTVTKRGMPIEMVDTDTLAAHDAPGPAVAEAVVAGAGA
jgi:hypothetical protein